MLQSARHSIRDAHVQKRKKRRILFNDAISDMVHWESQILTALAFCANCPTTSEFISILTDPRTLANRDTMNIIHATIESLFKDERYVGAPFPLLAAAIMYVCHIDIDNSVLDEAKQGAYEVASAPYLSIIRDHVTIT